MGELVEVGPGFWSVRGTFRLGGVVNIGTQAALVKIDDSFVMLDSYTLPPDVLSKIEALTGGADKVAAIVNLHPFHTIHTEGMQAQFPSAKLYGTARHKRLFPGLAWEETCSEDPGLWASFGPELVFSVPAGVELIPENENLHFGSVLAYHRPSGVVHVDDTFNALSLGWLSRMLGTKPRLSFHPTLSRVLEERPGAADDFEAWVAQVAEDWCEARVVCTAHNAMVELGQDGFGPSVRRAFEKVKPKLEAHRAKFG